MLSYYLQDMASEPRQSGGSLPLGGELQRPEANERRADPEKDTGVQQLSLPVVTLVTYQAVLLLLLLLLLLFASVLYL